MSKESVGTTAAQCTHPTVKHPFYHLSLKLTLHKQKKFKLKSVSINGKAMLDFYVYHNSRFQKNSIIESSGSNVVIVRFDWKAGEGIKIVMTGVLNGGREEAVVSSSVSASLGLVPTDSSI